MSNSDSYGNLPENIKYLYKNEFINLLPLLKGSKKPALNWATYQSMRTPESRLKSHDGNFGVILGDPLKSGLGYFTVLDIDDNEGESGIFRLFKDLDTLIVKTPSKGFHIYLMSEKRVENKDKLSKQFASEFELRGNNNLYVVLPPSTIELGNGQEGHHEIINEGNGQFNGIMMVEDVESLVSKRLEEAGYPPVMEIFETTPKHDGFNSCESHNGWPRELSHGEIQSIFKIISPINMEGNRHYVALYLAGWFKKAEISKKSAINAMEKIFEQDEDLQDRIKAVESTYELDIEPKGSSGIQKLMLGHLQSTDAVKSVMTDLKKSIVHPDSRMAMINHVYGLNNQNEKIITIKILAKWLKKRFNIVRDSLTEELYIYDVEKLYYRRLSHYEFQEFFSGLFPSEVFLNRETKEISSTISVRGTESHQYVAFKNGWLDVSTGELIEPKPEHFVKFNIPYKYYPNVNSPKMERFLHEVFDDGEKGLKLQGFLEFLGYSIMERKNPYHKLLIMYGEPGTGKSTIINILRAIFINSVSSITLHDVNERFGLESTVGKRVNLMYDLSAKSINDLGKIKAITGEDPMTIDRKFKPAITVFDHPKIIGTANNLPRITDDTKPFFERLILIELTNKFRNTDKNIPGLAHALINDSNAIEYLIKKALIAYIQFKLTNIWSMELSPEYIEREYLKSSNPSLYAASQIFKYSGDENNFITTEEAHELIIETLKIFELPIPADKRKFTWALESLGATKVRRRLDGELSWGYSSIVIKNADKIIKQPKIEFQTQIINMGDTNTAELGK